MFYHVRLVTGGVEVNFPHCTRYEKRVTEDYVRVEMSGFVQPRCDGVKIEVAELKTMSDAIFIMNPDGDTIESIRLKKPPMGETFNERFPVKE